MNARQAREDIKENIYSNIDEMLGGTLSPDEEN